jgi:hypothetical protein
MAEFDDGLGDWGVVQPASLEEPLPVAATEQYGEIPTGGDYSLDGDLSLLSPIEEPQSDLGLVTAGDPYAIDPLSATIEEQALADASNAAQAANEIGIDYASTAAAAGSVGAGLLKGVQKSSLYNRTSWDPRKKAATVKKPKPIAGKSKFSPVMILAAIGLAAFAFMG